MVEPKDGHGEERDFTDSLEDRFERELRADLRPRPAPEGFVERILQSRQLAAAEGRHFSGSGFPRRRDPVRPAGFQPWLRWGAAACLLLTVAGGVLQHEHERRQAGERARQQVLLALRITSTTLQDVRNKVENPRWNRTREREP